MALPFPSPPLATTLPCLSGGLNPLTPKAVILLNDRRLQEATLPPRAPKSRRTLLPLSDGINDDAQKD